MTQCPFSIRDTEGGEPYAAYEEMRSPGNVVWDEGMKAWLVLSTTGVREMLDMDIEKLRSPMADMGQVRRDTQGGGRHLKFLTGKDHWNLHRWWLRQLNARTLEQIRIAAVRPMWTA